MDNWLSVEPGECFDTRADSLRQSRCPSILCAGIQNLLYLGLDDKQDIGMEIDSCAEQNLSAYPIAVRELDPLLPPNKALFVHCLAFF